MTHEWQDIETAPQDGTDVLLFLPGDGSWMQRSVGHFDWDKYAKTPRPYWRAQIERTLGTLWMRKAQPTHWMPLPPAPEKSP